MAIQSGKKCAASDTVRWKKYELLTEKGRPGHATPWERFDGVAW